MFRQSACCSGQCARTALIVLLVAGMVDLNVSSALARQISADTTPSTVSTADVTALPVISLADDASRHLRDMFNRSMTADARRLAMAGQASSPSEKSRRWCAGGLALLGGGVTAAVVSGLRRDYNAQKPSPPVGVVLGTTAAAVGAIRMIRTCR